MTPGSAVSDVAPSTPGSCGSFGATSAMTSVTAPSVLAVRRSSSSSQVSGGVIYTFRCAKCLKVLPMTDMSPHRRNVCVKDTRSYKSLTERWAKNRALKIWWDGLSPEERINWFCKNQECQVGEKRKYGDISHADASIQQEHMGEEELDHFIPWDLFEEKGLRRGRSSTQLETEFIDIVQGGEYECLYRRNQWLVPKFCGVERRRGWKNMQRSTDERRASDLTPEDLRTLSSTSDKLRDEFAQQTPIAIMPLPSALPHIVARIEDQKESRQADDIMGGAIQREAVSSWEPFQKV